MEYHRPRPLDVESGCEMANDHAPMARRRLKISIAQAAVAAFALCIVFLGYAGSRSSGRHSDDKSVGQSISMAAARCSDITGSYIRSSDQALIKIEQTGCDAHLTRVNGTLGRAASSATLRGPAVVTYQSAPGRVQENGDIRFLSGVVYAKIKCSDISGTYMRSGDHAIFTVQQDGCAARFKRVDTRRQSAPGDAQENGDIRYTKIECGDISGAYMRSEDQAVFTVRQEGCAAQFSRVNGTVGSPVFSAAVMGTKITRHQSAPGDVQENGDIRFLSGVVYAKIKCGDISGAYIRSEDQALFTVKQKGCAAQFTRVNGTVGSPTYSVAVIGTKVVRHQSAPGDVQEDGDIRFLSGVLYAKVKCSDISGSFIRSADHALSRVEQTGCDAPVTRVNGTLGHVAFSADVRGIKVIRHQSAPGYVQENGDIRFASGVVYHPAA